VEEFREYSGTAINLCDAEITAELPSEVSAQLIRIIQEAMNNVRKHAHAKKVEISCHRNTTDIYIEIADDGAGFNVEDVPGPSKHGLRGMRERAELIGADLQVISQPKRGTIVRLRLPLVEKEKLS
jgi:signal transduction histidine kinase